MKIIDISKMDQKQIEEALMEVQLLKIVRYPYIVTYRESFMEKMYHSILFRCLCIVMDYC
jgi:NIMA (never in mitosis gene a)-related kinase 1/4/5